MVSHWRTFPVTIWKMWDFVFSVQIRKQMEQLLFSTRVLRRIWEKLSTPAVYVVPTSIHDVAIHDSIYVYVMKGIY